MVKFYLSLRGAQNKRELDAIIACQYQKGETVKAISVRAQCMLGSWNTELIENMLDAADRLRQLTVQLEQEGSPGAQFFRQCLEDAGVLRFTDVIRLLSIGGEQQLFGFPLELCGYSAEAGVAFFALEASSRSLVLAAEGVKASEAEDVELELFIDNVDGSDAVAAVGANVPAAESEPGIFFLLVPIKGEEAAIATLVAPNGVDTWNPFDERTLTAQAQEQLLLAREALGALTD